MAQEILATNTDVRFDVTMKDDFDEVLKQMRARRISACKAAKAKKQEEMAQATLAGMSDSFNGFMDDSSVRDPRTFWRTGHQSGQSLPSPTLSGGFDSSSSSLSLQETGSSSSPTSVQSVTDILGREIMSKIQLAFFTTKNTDNSRFGMHEERAKALQYSRQDLEDLIDDRHFAKLQRSLRNTGAVTNEILRQNLPWVIKQSQEAKMRRLSKQAGLLVALPPM